MQPDETPEVSSTPGIAGDSSPETTSPTGRLLVTGAAGTSKFRYPFWSLSDNQPKQVQILSDLDFSEAERRVFDRMALAVSEASEMPCVLCELGNPAHIPKGLAFPLAYMPSRPWGLTVTPIPDFILPLMGDMRAPWEKKRPRWEAAPEGFPDRPALSSKVKAARRKKAKQSKQSRKTNR